MYLFLICLTVSFVHGHHNFDAPDNYKEQWDNLFLPHIEECSKESGLEIKEVSNFFKRLHYPNKPEFKCFMKCLYLRLNFIDEKGNVNKEILSETIKGADMSIVDECTLLVQNETDLCEKVYTGVLCGLKAVHEKIKGKID